MRKDIGQEKEKRCDGKDTEIKKYAVFPKRLAGWIEYIEEVQNVQAWEVLKVGIQLVYDCQKDDWLPQSSSMIFIAC